MTNPNGKNQVNIGGTPSVAGTYNYKVTLTGGCGVTTTTGILTVLPNLTDITLAGNPATYNVEIRPQNGALLPIDLKCVYAIGPAKTGYAAQTQVTNITLWKTFFTSDANNSSTFLKDGLLYQGVNTNSFIQELL